jgi:hypothetical protein
MNKQFIPYELSTILKDLGFKEGCFAFYESLRKIGDSYCFNNYSMWGGISQNISESDDYHLYITLNELYGYYDNILRAPTWQQAFEWILSKYSLYAIIIPTVTMNWTFKTMTVVEGIIEIPPYNHVEASDYSSYEQVRLESLKELIRLIEEK